MFKKLKCFLGIHDFGEWKRIQEPSRTPAQLARKSIYQKTCKKCSIIKQKLI